MKTIAAIAGLVLLSLSAQAQDAERPQLRLKPLHKKLDLRSLEEDSYSSKLNSLGKSGNRYSLFPKSSAKSAAPAEVMAPRAAMPILKPDSTIQFSILALKPDSTIAFPMPVLKP
ncbi:hypothetical protein [Pontibacter amylolyticus]|uniref:Uncharacterized protein n=1 Tax=Pontibacter amylolyticus TaxID=1424080 RepID=A0ABQ1WFP9_9BACT|nr:hypothetical protein [Pontibacter amylolyticus]GGG28631.1 hypothetical protein GCM10011323_35030 [Pontibacter amylolyticus]